MPVVPMPPRRPAARSPLPGRDPPTEPWALMAAAQMHSEVRLVEPTAEVPAGGK